VVLFGLRHDMEGAGVLDDAEKSKRCLECGNCCKMVVAFFPVSLSVAHADETILWRLPRGITRIPALDRPGYEAWNIPSVCPWLDEKTNKCGIYETRPEVCRKWDGFQHPEVDCAWRDV
jgi:Fe-S-cluster containining protein